MRSISSIKSSKWLRTTFLLLLSCLVVFPSSMKAQQTDFDKVVLPIDMKSKDFREYLVQLAWLNNPDNHVLEEVVKQSEEELRLVKKDWMKDFVLGLNLNEANLSSGPDIPQYLFDADGNFVRDDQNQPIRLSNVLFDTNGNSIPLESAGGSAFYPRFNFGLNLNLGNILQQKNKNRVKKHDVTIADLKVKQQKLGIRAETLTRYQQLLMATEILKARLQLEQDANSNFKLINNLYRSDDKTFEDYNDASTAYTNAVESRIKAETEVAIAKFRLEEIIGLKWEEVAHPSKEPK